MDWFSIVTFKYVLFCNEYESIGLIHLFKMKSVDIDAYIAGNITVY